MRKKLWQRTVSLLLAGVIVVGAFAGCGGEEKEQESPNSETQDEGQQPSGADETNLLEDGMTYATGLPITKEKIELDVYVQKTEYIPDMETTAIWDYIEEKTNIRLNLKTLADSEKIALTFTGRDYPDMYMYVNIKTNQLNDAAAAGDLVELGSLLEEYAPTYYEFYQENQLTYKQALAADGNLYSLCYADFAPWEKGIRDVWNINGVWLEELGLELPTTTEEFKDVLLAFKENAGTGSIPEDVIPFHFVFNSYVMGQFDIFGSFGVYTPTADYLVVEDGVVKNQAVNPDIKEPLKYLNELYELGLIAPEAFTDSNNTAAMRATMAEGTNTVQVGACTNYWASEPYIRGNVLDSGNGSEPLIRSQLMAGAPLHNAIITKENEYPIATLRLLEWIVSDTEAMMTVIAGTKDLFWKFDEENKVELLITDPNEKLENSKDLGMNNLFVGLRDVDFYENQWVEPTIDEENSRAWAYYNLYEGKTIPQDMIYAGGALPEDDMNAMNLLATDLATCRNTYFADFICGRKDIDEEWDTYVNEMESLGHEKYMEYKQQAYDLIH